MSRDFLLGIFEPPGEGDPETWCAEILAGLREGPVVRVGLGSLEGDLMAQTPTSGSSPSDDPGSGS